ncbi:MAG: hypothetical protein AB7T49_14120 [Oligoflexales bacterium]
MFQTIFLFVALHIFMVACGTGNFFGGDKKKNAAPATADSEVIGDCKASLHGDKHHHDRDDDDDDDDDDSDHNDSDDDDGDDDGDDDNSDCSDEDESNDDDDKDPNGEDIGD